MRARALSPDGPGAYIWPRNSRSRILQLTTITDETRLALANLADRATGVVTPSVRLGVTGLSRAGKTVFIAALVHNLVHGGRLPLFKAYAGGPRRRRRGSSRSPTTPCRASTTSATSRALVEERLWPEFDPADQRAAPDGRLRIRPRF